MADGVVKEIIRQGRRKKVPKKHVKAALATGIVESGLRNLPGGDADSQGWRQERASLYPNPTNVRASVRRFYREAAQHDRGQAAGELAADVQRPAAQYRGRYGLVMDRAERIYRRRAGDAAGPIGRSSRGGRSVSVPTLETTEKTTFDQEGFEQAQRRQLVGSMLARRRGTDSVLFRSGLLSLTAPSPQDFTKTTQQTKMIPGTPAPVIREGALGAAAAHGGAQKAIKVASKKLGITEVAGSNRGRKVDRWQAKFNMVGQPWCGIFVGIALRRAGVKGITPAVASVAAIEDDAKAGRNGFKSWHSPRDAQPGDAMVTARGVHVGLVEKVDRKKGVIHTIEGNTGSGEVARRTHRMDSVHGVARPRYGRR